MNWEQLIGVAPSSGKVMEGYKIKINKASEDSYWYSDYIGSEFWSYVDKQNGGFTIVPEGTYCKDTLMSTRKNHWDKHVTEEDCEVVKYSHILVETNSNPYEVTVFVRDLHVDR